MGKRCGGGDIITIMRPDNIMGNERSNIYNYRARRHFPTWKRSPTILHFCALHLASVVHHPCAHIIMCTSICTLNEKIQIN